MVDPVRLAAARLRPFAGSAWRQQAPGFDPRSGEGARLHGGRFNPPNSYPVLYLCTTRACAVAELRRLGERQAIGVANLLPRELWRYEIQLERCLDLTDEDVLVETGIDRDLPVEPFWARPQQIGLAAHVLGVQAIISASATGTDTVISVFVENLGMSSLTAHLSEQWADLDSLEVRKGPQRGARARPFPPRRQAGESLSSSFSSG